MPRLLHMADVHLGARHHDLGEVAVQQRERQFAAFTKAVGLALSEKVDLVLVAGDLFDSNAQPRRSVERVAGELKRLVAAGIGTVVLPGTHDVYDPASIYRAYDLAALAGVGPDSAAVVVLTPERPDVVYPALDLAVHGRTFATKRAPESPLAGFRAEPADVTWHVGLIHGSLRIAGKVEADDVIFDEAEIAASGLDYLALGHWHSFSQGRAGDTTWAYAGAPEPVAVDQDGAGQVLFVTLDGTREAKRVTVQPRPVGQTTFRRLDIDASEIQSQDDLVRRLSANQDANTVLDARLVGVLPETLDLQDDEVERAVAPGYFRFRLRNLAVPAVVDGPALPPDTIAGAFVRDLEARIAAADAAGDETTAAELRESLRLGRLLLDDPGRVTLV